MDIRLPDVCLVVLIGASGSGKSTFARRSFHRSEIIESDTCREMICDDASSQIVTLDAFELVHFIAAKRLKHRRLTVIDATSVSKIDRESLLRIAWQYNVPAIAIVFELSDEVCIQNNAARTERIVEPTVIRNQLRELHRDLGRLEEEGFDRVHTLRSAAMIRDVRVLRDD